MKEKSKFTNMGILIMIGCCVMVVVMNSRVQECHFQEFGLHHRKLSSFFVTVAVREDGDNDS